MWLLPERTHHKYNDITDTTLCTMSDSNISSGKSFSKLLVSFKMYNVKVWFSKTTHQHLCHCVQRFRSTANINGQTHLLT